MISIYSIVNILEGTGMFLNNYYMHDFVYIRNQLPQLKSFGLLKDAEFEFNAKKLVKNWTEIEEIFVTEAGLSLETLEIIGRSDFSLNWVMPINHSTRQFALKVDS